MSTLVIVGAQWGDEGKGKIVDKLAAQAQVVVRFQGGDNAGHTVYHAGQKHVFHILPSGMLHPHVLNLIGGGIVVKELKRLQATGGFMKAFTDKGRLRKLMHDIPVRVILNDKTALLGAARFALDLA